MKIVRVDPEDPLETFEIVLARISDEQTRSISIQAEEAFDQEFNAKDERVNMTQHTVSVRNLD